MDTSCNSTKPPTCARRCRTSPGVFKFRFGTEVKYDGTNWDVLNEQLNGATEEKPAGLASDIGFISVVAGGSGTSCNCNIQEMTEQEVLQLLQ